MSAHRSASALAARRSWLEQRRSAARRRLGARRDEARQRQRRVNEELWSRTDLVKAYATRDLRPAEIMLLVRYREDVLDDEERRLALDAIHRVLAPNGLLIMSTHNRDYAPRRAEPLQLRGRSPLRVAITLARMPRWLRNRRRLLPLERDEAGYAILNDISHDFSALHYYIWHDAQRHQLAGHGFELLECLDLDGHRVEANHDAPDCPELHYVARRRATTGGPASAAGRVPVATRGDTVLGGQIRQSGPSASTPPGDESHNRVRHLARRTR